MATILGMMILDLHVPQADSLKGKRRIIKGFKDRLASRFNFSVAEVDAQDHHRRAVIAVAMVGSDKRYMEGALQKAANMASGHRDMILIDQKTEWY